MEEAFSMVEDEEEDGVVERVCHMITRKPPCGIKTAAGEH